MIDKKEVERWLGTLFEDSQVAIDEGGLILKEIASDGLVTGAYIEIGGISEEGLEESA